VPPSPRSHRFQTLAQLVDFNGQSREGQRLPATEAVLLDQRAQLGMTVQGGPTQPSASGDRGEGDVLARPDKIQANLLDAEHLVACGHDA
jgi:hypothetical protein